jgi:SAM-dependent methyltransferase
MATDAGGRLKQPKRSLWLWNFLSAHGEAAERMNEPLRRLAIEHLDLKAGERVLDVGCGTGPNFESLVDAVGPEGRVVGVDFSPRMVHQAERRISEHGWTNVEVVCADAARAPIQAEAYDAALAAWSLSAIADTGRAVETVYAALRPAGRIFVADLRLVPEGRAAPLIWLIGCLYRFTAGWSGHDVLIELRVIFPSVDLLWPIRPWPPLVFALARKAEVSTSGDGGQVAYKEYSDLDTVR